MKEVFKKIPNHEKYEVSNFGRVKSYNRGSDGFILKPQPHKKGYLQVTLSKRKRFYVHRLVMLIFIGESDLQVNHIDCDKTNNRLDNLEYVTCKENIRHAIENGKFKYNF